MKYYVKIMILRKDYDIVRQNCDVLNKNYEIVSLNLIEWICHSLSFSHNAHLAHYCFISDFSESFRTQILLYVKDNLTVATAVAGTTHAISMATPFSPAAGLAAGVGGAFGGGVAVAPLAALQVAHTLIELQTENVTIQITYVNGERKKHTLQSETHAHRQVHARLPRAPVHRQRVTLPQDHRSDGVESDTRVPAAGKHQQKERETHHQHQLTRHNCCWRQYTLNTEDNTQSPRKYIVVT